MCLMTAGLAEVLTVELLDHGVLVRLTDLLRRILIIKSFGAESLYIGEIADRCGNDRLTAAVDTSAGATHNFDEVIILLALLDHFEESVRRSRSAAYCNVNIGARDIHGRFLDRKIGAAAGGKVNIVKRFVFKDFLDGTESRLHNTAAGSEYNACTG